MSRLPAVVCVIALLACAAPGVGTETESGSETGSGSATDSGTEADGETESDSEDSMNMPTDSACEEVEDCPFPLACIEQECVAIEEPPSCTAPVMLTLPQPSANGRVVAIDLVDFQHDGDVEIVAWIDEVGIGVLDDGQWTKSEYLPAQEGTQPTIAAIHVDGDEHLDVLLHDVGLVQVGLGDGAGGFAITTQFPGLERLRGIEYAPGERRAFGVRDYEAAYLRFDITEEPTVVMLPYDARTLVPAQLDAGGPEDVVFADRCEAFPMRLRPTWLIDVAELVVEAQDLNCQWLSADLDGDGRDELVADESMIYRSDDPYATLLSAFANTTDTELGPPSFAARELAQISDLTRAVAAGDLDGDGDDEMLYLRGTEGGATMVWASDEQLLGCMADIPSFPDSVYDGRSGDIDGDGDDEIVVFRGNGELRVLDFQ